jgi:hypothetical protein
MVSINQARAEVARAGALLAGLTDLRNQVLRQQ